jgi:hypothetical protein
MGKKPTQEEVVDAAIEAMRHYAPRPIEFETRVSAQGYRWNGRGRERRLVPISTKAWYKLQPLREHTGLFRLFGDTATTERAVKAFAEKFGLLFGGEMREGDAGEKLADWASEIAALRLAIGLAGAHGPEQARKSIREAIDSKVLIDFEPEILRDFGATPLWLLRNLANRRLDKYATAIVLTSPDARQLNLALFPRNLVGALWLQLLQAVEGGVKFRHCVGCGEVFEVSRGPTGKRADAKYHSPACKLAAFRRRRS